MAVKTIQLSRFLKRLLAEQQLPFTWLIGAGMSASSGIPLAADVSRRIILFEYCMDNEPEDRPWSPQSTEFIRYKSDILHEFFDWYDALPNDNTFMYELLDKPIEWLHQQDDIFKDITPENPECYQRLFQHFFHNTDTAHRFLRTLVNRARGVNLAHLGLAGLLRDHFNEWGHTVFTTNFDDLLLKALLGLGHTARIFGDINSKDSATTHPVYPQIVHLHGRHTGYNLLNTNEQISLINEDLQRDFIHHLGKSSLIVIGYSGWDDLVKSTLELWFDKPEMIRGSIYWVPFQSQETMLPQMRDFLDKCPPNKVFIIEDEDTPLDADLFMLRLCQTLNKANGGFEPYRRHIIDFATQQHGFILEELKRYPDFDPSGALTHIELSKTSYEDGRIKDARSQLDLAKSRVKGEDIPNELKGEAFLGIGEVELYLGNIDFAEEYLLAALSIWEKLSVDNAEASIQTANTYKMLGELYLRTSNIQDAKHHLKKGRYIFKGLQNNRGFAITSKILGDIKLREGKTDKGAQDYFEESLSIYRDLDNKFGQAIVHRSLGEFHRLRNKDLDVAKQHYEQAYELFTEVGHTNGVANTLKSLGDLCLMDRNRQYGDSKDYYTQARGIYIEVENLLGIANVESSLGDLAIP